MMASSRSSSDGTGPLLDSVWVSVEMIPALQHEIYSEKKLGDYTLLRHLGEGQSNRDSMKQEAHLPRLSTVST